MSIQLSKLLLIFSFLPNFALAASLYLSPSSGSYSVDRTFNVNINVSSSDQSLNAVQGTLIFPPEQLSVIGVSKTGSIISLWVQDPTFNNSTGRITFEGIVLNPGFIGSAGRVLQITFRGKGEGSATLSLSNASVLANNGQGSNILTQLGNGKYLLEAPVLAPRLPTPETLFIISYPDGKETSNPRPRLKFEVKNFNKPIDHYDVRVDEEDFASWKDDGTQTYVLPNLELGKHTITVRAYYEADRFLVNTASITIKGTAKPVITEYPKVLNSGDVLVIKGTAQPNQKVVIYLQKDIDLPVNYSVNADESGEFGFAYDKRVSPGIYKFWAEAYEVNGAKSEPTEKYTVAVREAAILRIGSAVVNTITLIVTLAALLALLAFILMYSWYKLRVLKRDLDKEIEEGETSLHKIFRALKKDVDEQLEKLEIAGSKRILTLEEKEIRKTLMNHLDIAERFLEKELHDIEERVFKGHGGAVPKIDLDEEKSSHKGKKK